MAFNKSCLCDRCVATGPDFAFIEAHIHDVLSDCSSDISETPGINDVIVCDDDVKPTPVQKFSFPAVASGNSVKNFSVPADYPPVFQPTKSTFVGRHPVTNPCDAVRDRELVPASTSGRAMIPIAVTPAKTVPAVSFIAESNAAEENSVFVFNRYGKLSEFGAVCINEIKKWSSYLSFVEAAWHEKGFLHPLFPGATADGAIPEEHIQDLLDSGIDMTDASKSIKEILSDVVVESLLTPMTDIGVHSLSHGGFFAPRCETGNHMRELDKYKRGSFFFTPVMMVNKKVSFFNCKNNPEIKVNERGMKTYNKAFWKDNFQIKKNRVTGKNFFVLEMAIKIPEWTIPKAELHDHQDAMNWMASHGPVFPNGKFLFLSLKDSYAHVFNKLVESHMYASARLLGFQPLFLIKNISIQPSSWFGINHHQMSTMDLVPKSYLVLAGFYRGKDEDLELITLTNEKDKFMALRDQLTL